MWMPSYFLSFPLWSIGYQKAMAPNSSTLAWKIPWMEEPGRLQSMGSWRVRHNWATSLSLFTFLHWRRKWQPAPVFLPGKSQGQWSLMGCRHGVAQSWTRLKRLSSSSSSSSKWKCWKNISSERCCSNQTLRGPFKSVADTLLPTWLYIRSPWAAEKSNSA